MTQHTSTERQRSAGSLRQDSASACKCAPCTKACVRACVHAGNHPNIVEVVGVYYTTDEHGSSTNLVMECVPQTLRKALSFLHKRDMRIKLPLLQIYAFQVQVGGDWFDE